MGRAILFVTDYGAEGAYVGLCHVVVERLAPGTRMVDVTHSVPPGDVLAGALALAEAVRFAPEDAVALAIVDPGVGTPRRALAVGAGRAWLVGLSDGEGTCIGVGYLEHLEEDGGLRLISPVAEAPKALILGSVRLEDGFRPRRVDLRNLLGSD